MEHLHDQSNLKKRCSYQVKSDYATKMKNTHYKRHNQGYSSTTMGSDSYYQRLIPCNIYHSNGDNNFVTLNSCTSNDETMLRTVEFYRGTSVILTPE